MIEGLSFSNIFDLTIRFIIIIIIIIILTIVIDTIHYVFHFVIYSWFDFLLLVQNYLPNYLPKRYIYTKSKFLFNASHCLPLL